MANDTNPSSAQPSRTSQVKQAVKDVASDAVAKARTAADKFADFATAGRDKTAGAMADDVRDSVAGWSRRVIDDARKALPSYRNGGRVRKSGAARLHKGERIASGRSGSR